MKICSQCKQELPFEKFNKRATSKDGYRCECRECQKSKHILKPKDANSRLTHDEIMEVISTMTFNNEIERKQEYDKLYYQKNKEKKINAAKEDRREPKNQIISHINITLTNHSKQNKIDLKTDYTSHLRNSIDEIVAYIELLFENWMTWENNDRFNKSDWDDTDSTTWSWFLGHKKTLKDFPYSSYEDDNFKKYWALDNFIIISNKPRTEKPKNAKIDIDQNTIEKMAELYKSGLGARAVAAQVNLDRSIVIRELKNIGVYDSNRVVPRTAYLQTEKTCKMCLNTLSIDNFEKFVTESSTGVDRISFNYLCFECQRKDSSIRSLKRYHKVKNDPDFILRSIVSYTIWNSLKNNNATKNGQSCMLYLKYTISELRDHIESLFEPWMSWDNYGAYVKSDWNDNDQSTWKWNIDHIIPQSTLPYSSMEDDNFKTCWALDNLRPYSAKQNNIDGTQRVRHVLGASF